MKTKWAGLGLALAVVACGGNDKTMSTVQCDSNVPGFADVAIFAKCTMCHSSKLSAAARKAAPPDINFDVYATASKNATQGADAVMIGEMPPKGSGITVTDAEKQAFYRWAMCGSPQ